MQVFILPGFIQRVQIFNVRPQDIITKQFLALPVFSKQKGLFMII